MFCKLISYCLNGLEPIKMEVEVDLTDGLPSFDIVGLPDSAVRESRERVKSAIKNSGFDFPIKRITVNLAPADLKKEGSLYDLPIALGILCCMGYITPNHLKDYISLGELALNGDLRPLHGILSILYQSPSYFNYILPFANASELAFINLTNPLYFHSLKEVVDFFNTSTAPVQPIYKKDTSIPHYPYDFSSIKGQESLKRSLMIAAAGNHNLLLIGPPGCGKTMLAKCLPGIMPSLSENDKAELTHIHSLAKPHSPVSTINYPPFRAPHHTTTVHGLVGGGLHPKPGEVSLAHKGILFLDELLEFDKKVLEVLREPLESGTISLSRSQGHYEYPAQFLFVAATNPCPCGYYPNPSKCRCDMPSIRRYLNKLSGPLLDRIDLHLEIQPVNYKDLSTQQGLSTVELSQKVKKAFKIQQNRFLKDTIKYNSQMPPSLIDQHCLLTPEAEQLVESWFKHVDGSARSYHRLLCMSRTIADLDDLEIIDEATVSEAISYRVLDKKFWA